MQAKIKLEFEYLYETYDFWTDLSFIPYGDENVFILGFVMGLGVLLGDAVESVIKRQLDIAPGDKFFPWDQLDSLIGGLVLLSIVYIPPWEVFVTLFALSIIVHVSIRHVGYWLRINESPW